MPCVITEVECLPIIWSRILILKGYARYSHFRLFYERVKSVMKYVFQHQDLQIFSLKWNKHNISNFHPLEFVERCRRT